MKIKLSLAALLMAGSSLFADVHDVSLSGNAKFFYNTNDIDQVGSTKLSGTMFNKDESAAQFAGNINLNAHMSNEVSGKIGATFLSTLGLENNLADNTWAANVYSNTSSLKGEDTQWWINEAWLAKTFGKTTLKIGRQYLDTPLAFSEKWNIASNSFDSIVLINQSAPKTSLVAAWIGRGNGANNRGVVYNGSVNHINIDSFRTFGSAIDDTLGNSGQNTNASGAYAAGLLTEQIPNTKFQAWFYELPNIGKAFWLQADGNSKKLSDLYLGLQYANLNPDNNLFANGQPTDNLDNSHVFAIQATYNVPNKYSVQAAFSKTSDDGAVNISNTATGLGIYSQSKLYTEAAWNFGYIGRPSTKAYKVSGEYVVNDIPVNASYVYSNQDTGKYVVNPVNMREFAVSAEKSFGNLNTKLMFVNTKADNQNNNKAYNTVNLYLTYNF